MDGWTGARSSLSDAGGAGPGLGKSNWDVGLVGDGPAGGR